MTIRELITKLAAYPPDAKIHLIGLEEPWLVDQSEYTLDEAQALCEDCSDNVLFIDGRKTDDNAYRRGALDQLFDEVSTGIPSHDELKVPSDAEIAKWEAEGGTTDIEDDVRQALEGPLNLLLETATAFVTNALLEDWPDSDSTREQVNERYWGRLEDELKNTPADISDDVREYTNAWDVFINLVFDRANKAAKAARGY